MCVILLFADKCDCAIFKRLVFLHTGRVNKVGVVSTSGLNENLE